MRLRWITRGCVGHTCSPHLASGAPSTSKYDDFVNIFVDQKRKLVHLVQAFGETTTFGGGT